MAKSKTEVELLEQHGYRLQPEGSGFRVWKTKANLFGAFWCAATVSNVAREYREYGERNYVRYRDFEDVRNKYSIPPHATFQTSSSKMFLECVLT